MVVHLFAVAGIHYYVDFMCSRFVIGRMYHKLNWSYSIFSLLRILFLYLAKQQYNWIYQAFLYESTFCQFNENSLMAHNLYDFRFTTWGFWGTLVHRRASQHHHPSRLLSSFGVSGCRVPATRNTMVRIDIVSVVKISRCSFNQDTSI